MRSILPENTDTELFSSAAYLLEKYGSEQKENGKAYTVSFYEKDFQGDDYSVESDGDTVKIYGSTAVAFNAAVGKLLRTRDAGGLNEKVHFRENIRGVYFANHFNNFYHKAPLEKIFDYMEELALFGVSVIELWFDMHHFERLDTADSEEMIERMKAIFRKAKKLGMKTSLTKLANEYYSTAPKELLAENSTENGLYKRNLCGFYHTEICPSKPKGEGLILQSTAELLEKFSDPGLDYLCLWPYDQGGCTCKDCYPWGAKGFYDLAEKQADMARKILPGIKIIGSCWYFESFTDGEWTSFIQRMKEKKPWFDIIMVNIGAYIPEDIAHSGYPVLSFPEISMHGCVPWGGFGANPLPGVLKKQFSETSEICSGGIMYSEGVFDDINKVLSLELMRDPDADTESILKEYCAFYFGHEYAAKLADIIKRLEKTLFRARIGKDGIRDDYPAGRQTELPTFVFSFPEDIESIKSDFEKIHAHMPEKIKESFRYKMLYLRAVGDFELYRNGGVPNEKTDAVFSRLTEIYHSEQAHYCLAPVTRNSCLEIKGGKV